MFSAGLGWFYLRRAADLPQVTTIGGSSPAIKRAPAVSLRYSPRAAAVLGLGLLGTVVGGVLALSGRFSACSNDRSSTSAGRDQGEGMLL